jgi:hypothetical protein
MQAKIQAEHLEKNEKSRPVRHSFAVFFVAPGNNASFFLKYYLIASVSG